MKKICFIASSGGHFTQMQKLKPLMDRYDSFVVTEKTDGRQKIDVKTYYLKQVNRKEPGFFPMMISNAFKSLKIFLKERPDVVVSTGVLSTIPMCIIAKIFRKKVIYIESFAKVHSPTLTGKFMYKVADNFFVQWKSMLKVFPKAIYKGALYDTDKPPDLEDAKKEKKDDRFILVTLGTQKFQFNRLLKEIDRLIECGIITDEVFAQTGGSDYIPKHYNSAKFLSPEKMRKMQKRAGLIITHGGSGSVVEALKMRKKIIAVPRLSRFGEHVDDHQVEIIEEFSKDKYIIGSSVDELRYAIDKAWDFDFKPYESSAGKLIGEIEKRIGGK